MSLSLLLRCRDLGETRDFYASRHGFSVHDSADETLTVEGHGGRLVFTAQDLWESEPAMSGTIYFTVNDVDSIHVRMQAEPATQLAWPLQQMPYGSREFAIIDCNGYVLAFQQRL